MVKKILMSINQVLAVNLIHGLRAYEARTISLLLIGACFLIWASGALDPESTVSRDAVTLVKRGVWAMIVLFLAYCLLLAASILYKSSHHIQVDTLVANCNSNNSRVQYVPPKQKTSKESWCFLLALPCYLHR